MTLAQPQRTSLVESTIKAISAEIRSGRWPVEFRLPPEPELASQLGVGRNTVREAVRALVHNGMLESRQGAGVFVVSTSEVTAVLQRHLMASEPGEVVEVRLVLESGIAGLAAQRRSAEDLEAIGAALREREKAVQANSPEEFIQSDLEFHAAVAAASHNTVLSRLYADFEPFVRANLAQQVQSAGDGQLPAIEHDTLYAALQASDVNAAVSAAQTYLELAARSR